MSLFSRLRSRQPRSVDISVVLAEELADMDRTNPGWDTASRISTAADALNRGTPDNLVAGVYGKSAVAVAKAINVQAKLDPASSRKIYRVAERLENGAPVNLLQAEYTETIFEIGNRVHQIRQTTHADATKDPEPREARRRLPGTAPLTAVP